ncbi:MAG: class I SAM-dependent methyltransferase [Alphaproteobacteria bacterium]|nr:class I SAM-dependent methyltransferase [Alphaproteobacteria bacterium]
MMYDTLCTEFYDIDKKFAPSDEVLFYKQFMNKNDLSLEAMCGSGRLLIPLIQEGYIVHGVDNSVSMLNSCKERGSKLDLGLTLFEADIEIMDLPNQYSLILIPLGSFQLLYPRLTAFNVLKNFKKHLKLGGKIILDLFVPWDAMCENNQEEFTEREVLTPDSGKIIIKSHNITNKKE